MPIVNIAKPSTALTNSAKVASFETWATIPTTWASEVRTWDATVSLFAGFTKISSAITNTIKPAP